MLYVYEIYALIQNPIVNKTMRFCQFYWVSSILSVCLLVYVYVLHTSFPRLGTVWPKHLNLCQIPVVTRKRERHGKNGDSCVDMCPNDHLKIESLLMPYFYNFFWTPSKIVWRSFKKMHTTKTVHFWFFFISFFPYQALSLKVGNAF